jgi:hypothetical protein
VRRQSRPPVIRALSALSALSACSGGLMLERCLRGPLTLADGERDWEWPGRLGPIKWAWHAYQQATDRRTRV